MKVKNLIIVLTIGLVIFACSESSKTHDPVNQSLKDDEALVEYLKTHYLNEEDGGIWTITDGSQTPLMEQVEIQDDIIEDDVSYTLYYLVQEEGVTNSPTKIDSVLTTYTGMTLDSIVFDRSIGITWLELSRTIKGWGYGFEHYKGGNKFVNPDESFYYEDYGEGILFIPSGLAYGNTGSNVIPPNTSLIFEITLQDIKKVQVDD